MVILVNDEQPSNALSPIDFTLAGKVISFKLVQPLKAPSFMDSTLAGKDMEVRLVLPAKALFPIALINFPLYFREARLRLQRWSSFSRECNNFCRR